MTHRPLPSPDLHELLDTLSDPFFVVDAAWRYTYVNAQAAAFMGATPSQLLGQVLWECAPEALETPLNEHYRRVMATREGAEFDLYYPALSVWVAIRAFPYAGGLAVHFQDITGRRLAGERQARLLDLTRALAAAPSERAVAEAALAVGLPALGAYGGLLLRLDAAGEALVPVHAAGYDVDLPGRWPHIPLPSPFPSTQAVRSGEAVFVRAAGLAAYPALAGGLSSRTRALAALPLALEGRVLGALVLSFDTDRTFGASERDFMTSLAGQLTQALERARLLDAERRARRRLELLGRASETLAASLDSPQTLRNVMRLAVDTLADWAMVDLVEDGRAVRVAAAHARPEAEPLAQAMLRWPPLSGSDTPVARALRGESVLLRPVSDEVLVRGAQGDDHLATLRALKPGALIAVPLRVRDDLLGALTLVCDNPAHGYDEDDLALAEELARRAAVAVGHARAHAAEREGRERAQRLLDLGLALGRAQTAQEVLDAVLAGARAATAAAGSAVLVPDEDGGHLRVAGTDGHVGFTPAGARLPLDAPAPATEALRDARPVFVTRGTYAGQYPHLLAVSGARRVAALPLVAGGRTLGVLSLSYADDLDFTAGERTFLETLAGQAAQALERAGAHAELTRGRAQLAAILDQMPAAIWVAQLPTGRLVVGNSAIERILRHEYRPAQSIGEYGRYVGLHPDGQPYAAHEWPLARTVLTGERVENEEIEMLRGDGTRGFVSYSSALIRGEAGEPTLAVVTGVDVTELRELNAGLEARVEERTAELQARHEELAAETAALQAFAHLTEQVGREADLGTLAGAAVRVLHRALGEGSTGYYELEGGLWRQRAWDGDMEAPTLEAAQAGFPEEAPLFAGPARSGEPLFVDGWRSSDDELARHTPEYGALAVYPVAVGGRTAGQLAAGLRDKERWSERDRAVLLAVGRALTLAAERAEFTAQLAAQGAALEAGNRELQVLNRELEAFSYSVSHDLRAPLRHIQGFAALLRRALADTLDERAGRYLGLIETSAASANTLIDELLGFARAATQELRVQDVDLSGLVAEVRATLAPDLAGRALRWEVGPLPTVRGDRALLRQVLTNLLSNAVKYTRTRGEAVIEVSAGERAGADVIHVRDNGVGFDPQYAARLFGVFQRLHRAEDFEGVGIGLANVRRILERHGGEVWAEGAVGGGATFSFSLPRSPASPEA